MLALVPRSLELLDSWDTRHAGLLEQLFSDILKARAYVGYSREGTLSGWRVSGLSFPGRIGSVCEDPRCPCPSAVNSVVESTSSRGHELECLSSSHTEFHAFSLYIQISETRRQYVFKGLN